MESYAAFLHQLYAARSHGVRLGLERMHACLEYLDHPDRKLGAIVHIGGTNGKGSTAWMVESMLRAAGIRTGLFTSPHLIRFAERFRIAGQCAKESEIEAIGRRLCSFVSSAGPLTFFEIATGIALELFAQKAVEVAILEVGLGGRLDATNAVHSHVAVITGIAMDHEKYLGNTLPQIAREKAGIFKPGQMGSSRRAGRIAGNSCSASGSAGGAGCPCPIIIPFLPLAYRRTGSTSTKQCCNCPGNVGRPRYMLRYFCCREVPKAWTGDGEYSRTNGNRE